jgi:integrase
VLFQRHSEPYKNFINTVDSEATKYDYIKALEYFMRFTKKETYGQLFSLATDPKKLEGIIRDYIIHLKERKLSSSTVSTYINPVLVFYQMNDITLNTKKLAKYRGKKHGLIDDKPYTRQQIKHLLDFASLRMKCVILLMASAGLRRGAIPSLKIGDL